jgi:hypothetical protein
VPHAFFHHRKAVEKILLVTQKAARHHPSWGSRKIVERFFGSPLTL